MSYSSQLLEEAVDAFSRLPGIGKKSALRMAMHLIKSNKSEIKSFFIQPIEKLVSDIKFCKECNYLSDQEKCNICLTRERSAETLCIVENIRDVMAIEETGQFKGLYHVLGGVISPLDGVTADQLNISNLTERILDSNINEVILAISPTIEGETTIYYLSKMLEPLQITLSQLARGISFGGELAYADEMTLGRSILTRTQYKINQL